jgi:hypothetical protein
MVHLESTVTTDEPSVTSFRWQRDNVATPKQILNKQENIGG